MIFEWINTQKELPPPGLIVLACGYHKEGDPPEVYPCSTSLKEGKVSWDLLGIDKRFFKVICWMDLPSPITEENLSVVDAYWRRSKENFDHLCRLYEGKPKPNLLIKADVPGAIGEANL